MDNLKSQNTVQIQILTLKIYEEKLSKGGGRRAWMVTILGFFSQFFFRQWFPICVSEQLVSPIFPTYERIPILASHSPAEIKAV